MSVSKRLIINVTLFLAVASGSILTGCRSEKEPVDYVNPYIGNISHLLVPTYPTVHLPNSMLRVYPKREDFTGNRLNGLPVVVSRHRGIVRSVSIRFRVEMHRSISIMNMIMRK